MRLKDMLAGILPAEVLPYVSNRFVVIGDIAVIRVPAELDPWKYAIAQAIVSHRKNLVTVVDKKDKVAGGPRTARYEILLGTRTETVHRESGFAYRLDVSRAFFSTRMVSERKRVTGQTRPGERVYIPFAGVGPFVIPAAARGAEVYAMEKNPFAFTYLQENADLNHVTARCHILQGDASDTSPFTGKIFDRLIIPTPYGMDNALGVLLPLLSPGGMVHYYTFRAKEQIPGLIAAFIEKGLTVTYSSPCGNVAPGISRWVFDMTRTPQQQCLRKQREKPGDSMISEEK